MQEFCTLLTKDLYLKLTIRSVILAAVLIGFIACSKNNPASQPDLSGTWKLSNLKGGFDDTGTYVRNDTVIKQIQNQTYSSTLTAGSVTFSGNTTSSDSLFVHVIMTQHFKQYFNDVLNQDTTITSGHDQPTMNVQSTFTMVGSDSLYFVPLEIPLTRGLNPSGTDAASFTLSGNTLTLYVDKYTIQNSPSTSDHLHQTTTTEWTRQ